VPRHKSNDKCSIRLSRDVLAELLEQVPETSATGESQVMPSQIEPVTSEAPDCQVMHTHTQVQQQTAK
jgi:hypothetical protein